MFFKSRVHSRKKTHFRECDSTKVTAQSVRSTATGKPGKPAPDPMSAILSGTFGKHAPNDDIRRVPQASEIDLFIPPAQQIVVPLESQELRLTELANSLQVREQG